MNKKLATATNFVKRNKTAIVVGAVAITVIALQQSGLQAHNKFLKEHNLFDLYYTPDADV